MMGDLSMREQDVLGVLRDSPRHWLPLWEVAKAAGCSINMASAAVAGLRRKQLVVKRPCAELTRIEVSLIRSGVQR